MLTGAVYSNDFCLLVRQCFLWVACGISQLSCLNEMQ